MFDLIYLIKLICLLINNNKTDQQIERSTDQQINRSLDQYKSMQINNQFNRWVKQINRSDKQMNRKKDTSSRSTDKIDQKVKQTD